MQSAEKMCRTCNTMKKRCSQQYAEGEQQQDLGPSQAEVSMNAGRVRAPRPEGPPADEKNLSNCPYYTRG